MSMIRRRLAALSLLTLAAGCSSGTEPSTTLWEATLSPLAPSTMSGSAAAVAQAGRTRIEVEIRQAVAGESYRWRVSQGTCASEGALVGGAALYPVLTADPSRSARADAAVPGQLAEGGAYAVRVVRPGTPGGEQVMACGALLRTS